MEESPDANPSFTLTVRVLPRASKTEIVGEHNGAIKIKLRSPPADGAANEELVQFLSKLFNIPKTNVAIFSGRSSRIKRVRLTGASVVVIERFLQGKI